VARTDPQPIADPEPSDQAANNGPSKRVVTAVALIVGILLLVVGVLRLFGVGRPYEPVDSDEALDAAADVVRTQQAQSDVEAYVRANDPLLRPSESVLATCTPQDEMTFSCTVMITGDSFRTETMTVTQGMDGRWAPAGP
jgi:hypothetical protein